MTGLIYTRYGGKMFDMFPDAVQQKDKCGCFPLHYACLYNKFETVKLKLIDMFPDAAQYL
jgi:hypothetical protein